MAIRDLKVQRFSLTSSKSFQDVIAVIDSSIGHPDMKVFFGETAAAKTHIDLEKLVERAVGPSGLMEFMRFNMGGILRKYPGAKAGSSIRLLIGNPVVMKQMAEHVPDAASYAPVTVLVDERSEGVCLSYDRMASFLAPYENSEALRIARDLDSKIEKILTDAAS
jgi:uncharacterized protein (DUF302 family)